MNQRIKNKLAHLEEMDKTNRLYPFIDDMDFFYLYYLLLELKPFINSMTYNQHALYLMIEISTVLKKPDTLFVEGLQRQGV